MARGYDTANAAKAACLAAADAVLTASPPGSAVDAAAEAAAAAKAEGGSEDMQLSCAARAARRGVMSVHGGSRWRPSDGG